MIYALCFFAGCFCGAVVMDFMAGASRLNEEYDTLANALTKGESDGNRRTMQVDFNHLDDSGDVYFCDPDVARICQEHKRRSRQLNASAEK